MASDTACGHVKPLRMINRIIHTSHYTYAYMCIFLYVSSKIKLLDFS